MIKCSPQAYANSPTTTCRIHKKHFSETVRISCRAVRSIGQAFSHIKTRCIFECSDAHESNTQPYIAMTPRPSHQATPHATPSNDINRNVGSISPGTACRTLTATCMHAYAHPPGKGGGNHGEVLRTRIPQYVRGVAWLFSSRLLRPACVGVGRGGNSQKEAT